jgi:hypothetical protein
VVPDGNGKSMPAGIWYPSNIEASPHPAGMLVSVGGHAAPRQNGAGRRTLRPLLSLGAFQLPEQERVRVCRFAVLLSARRADAVACIVIDPQQDGLARVTRHL